MDWLQNVEKAILGIKGGIQTDQKIKNTIYNKDIQNTINETISKVTSRNSIKAAKKCFNTSRGTQQIKIYKLNAKGSIEIIIGQTMELQADFSCINTADVKASTVADMSSQILDKITAKMSNETKSNLDSNISEKKVQDWLSQILQSDVDAKTKQRVENNIKNITETNMKNIFQSIVDVSFSQSDFDSCIATLVGEQGFEAGDVTAGKDITIKLTQDMTLKSVTSCVQGTATTNKILTHFSLLTDLIKDTTFDNASDTIETAKTTIVVRGSMFGDLDWLKYVLIGGSLLILCIVIIIVIYKVSKHRKVPPYISYTHGYQPHDSSYSFKQGGMLLNYFKQKAPVYSPITDTLNLNM